MGKATIIESLGRGQYVIRPEYGTSTYEEMRKAAKRQEDQAVANIAQLDPLIADAESALSLAQSELQTATDALISGLREGGPATTPEYSAAFTNRANAQSDLAALTVRRNLHIARRDEARQTINELDAKANPEKRAAWCADFVEGVEGEVASIEVPDEAQAPIIIYPQFSEGRHRPARDGQLVPREWQTAPQAYLNAAILPGVQKHRPVYRIGEVLNIDKIADTAVVRLDEALSSAQNLPINQQDRLVNVPVQYMDCNASAFEAGDRVVVRFHQEGDPTVIGFESNPKPCSVKIYAWEIAQFNLGGSLRTINSGEVFEINRGDVDKAEDVFNIAAGESFPYQSGSWPGTRFAVHNQKTYSAVYYTEALSLNRRFLAGTELIEAYSDGGVPGIACSSDKVFTMMSNLPDEDRAYIKVWSTEDLSLLGAFNTGPDTEAFLNLAASETHVAIPVRSLVNAVDTLRIYTHAGALITSFGFSSPYRPMAICSDGEDFAVTVEQVIDGGGSYVWVYSNTGALKSEFFIDGTSAIGGALAFRNRALNGIAMSKRFIAVSLTEKGKINIYDREDGNKLVAVRDAGPEVYWVDLNTDSAYR